MNNRSAPRPPWCGSCDRVTRQREDADGRPYRCPQCHPKRAGQFVQAEPGEANVDPWWASGARRVIEQLAAEHRPFVVDEVRAILDSEPPEPRSWGTVIRQAHQDGVIEPVGIAQSTLASRRSGLVRQWIGVQP